MVVSLPSFLGVGVASPRSFVWCFFPPLLLRLGGAAWPLVSSGRALLSPSLGCDSAFLLLLLVGGAA